MELNLADKVAIVTGASRGIGLATTRALVNEGAHVIGASRTPSAELGRAGALSVAVDLTDRDAAERLVNEAVQAYGRVDLLVNNVGGGERLTLATFPDLDDEDWDDAFETNCSPRSA